MSKLVKYRPRHNVEAFAVDLETVHCGKVVMAVSQFLSSLVRRTRFGSMQVVQ